MAEPVRSTRVWIPPTAIDEQCEQELHVLLWQVRGIADVVVDGEEHVLGTGSAMWVPVATPHAVSVRANSVTMPAFFRADEVTTTLRTPSVVTVDRSLRTLLLAYVVASTTIMRPGVDLARQILAIVEGSGPRPAAPTLPLPTTPSAHAIASALRRDPGDRRSVEELAAWAHASPRTVERAFQAETGITLRTWRIRARVEAAAAFLRDDVGVEAVAGRVGYASSRALARVFVTHMGMTPAAYVRRFRAEW